MNISSIPTVWQRILQAAVWTPSPHNTQPWKIRILNAVEATIFIDRAGTYSTSLFHRRHCAALFIVLTGVISFLSAAEPSKKHAGEAVIVLHGIMNKAFVTAGIASALEDEGYEVHNWGYPSTEKLIEDHAANLNKFIQGLKGRKKIHFVGFSQGAIIIRYMLTHYAVPNAGRFVMIAPPNHGSEEARDYYKYAWFRALYGDKSIKELFAHQNEFLKKCGIPKIEFAVIAGGKNDGKGYSDSIPGDDDGVVSVTSARLEGMRDLIVLAHRHTPLIFSSDAASQAVYFLNEGKFRR